MQKCLKASLQIKLLMRSKDACSYSDVLTPFSGVDQFFLLAVDVTLRRSSQHDVVSCSTSTPRRLTGIATPTSHWCCWCARIARVWASRARYTSPCMASAASLVDWRRMTKCPYTYLEIGACAVGLGSFCGNCWIVHGGIKNKKNLCPLRNQKTRLTKQIGVVFTCV